MFRRVLIANRGEIACRIQRTCHALGIETVAVYSDADEDALHVRMADHAFHIGGARPTESYLDADRILAAARESGADAVHPGYGFLSENAGFARACLDAGIVFIGPTTETIEQMGSKAEAKRTMIAAGVATVPGYHGDDQDDATLTAEAARIGFPLMVKATAGGGGKGMRIVRAAEEFAAALAGARREADNAFGDRRVLLERYLETPRHIEVQIVGDTHGKVLHLFERDCSSQRRYQKVIEEAPAPGISAATREAMCEAAVRAAQAVAYVNAGTVEFIVDTDDNFYFMEMNTRLQVEHPVTEAITGVDLVAWQLLIAAGDMLPVEQSDLQPCGHAFEARVYAEDPQQGFMPSSGRLRWLEFAPGARIETGVRSGDEVTIHYDPMIAKIIVHGPDRAAALTALGAALDQTVVRGPATNLAFLKQLAAHHRFVSGTMDTGFLDRALQDVLGSEAGPMDQALVAGALVRLMTEERQALEAAAVGSDPHSPWAIADGWRPGHPGRRVVSLAWESSHHRIEARGSAGNYDLDLTDGEDTLLVRGAKWSSDRLTWRSGGQQHSAVAMSRANELHIVTNGRLHAFTAENPFAHEPSEADCGRNVMAPMPGRIVSLGCTVGEGVTEGQTVMVMEAMKMELTLTAPAAGLISAIHVAEGDFVDADTVLVEIGDA